MLPVIIEDMIKKTLDKNTHFDKRQFYYNSLIQIRNALDKAIKTFEQEKIIHKK